MLSSLLKLASIASCLIVAFSFAAFASDQAGKGSSQQVAKIASEDGQPIAPPPNVDVADPSASTERRRERQHGPLREKVDDANDVLTKPFAGVVTSNSIWAQRIVGALLAFLAFGVGLSFLGRWAATRGL